MAKAVLCPVCNGQGTLKVYPKYQSTGNYVGEETCHGCNGKGWVEISDGCCKPYYNPYQWWTTAGYVGDDCTVWLNVTSSDTSNEED